MYDIYKKDLIEERHRHSYELNLKYKKSFEKAGLVFSAESKSGKVEALEYPENDFFLAVQYHPEFISRPLRAHPLFVKFLEVIIKK